MPWNFSKSRLRRSRASNDFAGCYNLGMSHTPTPPSIILLTGTPGAGKSTIAEALSRTFAQSAHVPVDFFRKLIKSGYASPHYWNEEVERQYRLARKSAALFFRRPPAASIARRLLVGLVA